MRSTLDNKNGKSMEKHPFGFQMCKIKANSSLSLAFKSDSKTQEAGANKVIKTPKTLIFTMLHRVVFSAGKQNEITSIYLKLQRREIVKISREGRIVNGINSRKLISTHYY